MKKNNILYISNSCFPYNAVGIRISNIAILLKNNGHNLFLYSNNDFSSIPNTLRENIVYKIYDGMYEFEHNHCNYYYLKNKKRKFQVLFNLFELLFNRKQLIMIKKLCIKEKINVIFLYNPLYKLAKKVFNYAKKNNIKVIIDNTEWYQLENASDFANKFVAKSVNKRILKLDKKIDNIIAISPWMNKWYHDRGIDSKCVMPIMLDFHEPKYENIVDDYINIIYCGIPGKKDLLIPFVNAIKNYNKNDKKFKLTIIGVDKSNFNEDLEKFNIFALGKIPHDQVGKYYEKAHFSCLFRKKLVYAKAGFSTKVAESLCYGVPVLCNIVGGTDDIIENGINGYKIFEFNEECIMKLLNDIAKLDNEQLFNLRINSYNLSKKYFDMSNYTEIIEELVK